MNNTLLPGERSLLHKLFSLCLLVVLLSTNNLPTSLPHRTIQNLAPTQVEPAIELDDREHAEERADWFTFQRTYPFNEIPGNARRAAWEQTQNARTRRESLTVEPAA